MRWGRGGGGTKMFRPTASALQTFCAWCKKKKTKRILMCEVTVFLRTVNAWHFHICVACSFFCVKNAVFSRKCNPCACMHKLKHAHQLHDFPMKECYYCLRTTWHKTCCKWKTLYVLHMICTWACLGHKSIHVGDSSRCSEDFFFSSWIVPFNTIIIVIIKILY